MENQKNHTILLGGVGGDSHSVGLNILRQALARSGYRVRYLGTQNRLEDFFQLASMCNAVLISSMDGHTRYYLREFLELMSQYKCHSPLWYLGGNLHIGEGYGYDNYFLEMGFDRVFVKFVDVKTVLKTLEMDLDAVEPVADCPTLWEQSHLINPYLSQAVSDEQLEQATFERSRREVLDSWKTGNQAKLLEENAEFLGRQASFPKSQALVKQGRQSILIQPRSGVPLLEEQIRLFKAFEGAGVRVLSYQVDSLTRNNNYAGAEEAIIESRSKGASTINGFPVINHGVTGLRRVISEVNVPLQTRHSTRDPRLLAEISYAGGVTAFEGGAICYNIPYYKNYPLAESIKTWQYVDRLTGLYHRRFDITLDREFFGTLTATLIPPCLAIAVDIIEAILAIRQGVKCVSLGYAEQGNRVQDIAAIHTLARMASEIIQSLGYRDIQINTVFHQYMAAFPDASERAEELIYNSAITAALSGATRVLIKTPAEAYKIPTMEDNLHGIGLVMRGISAAADESVDWQQIADECSIIRQETQSIIDSIILAGKGSIADGVVSGFQKGFIDIPFSPSMYNRAETVSARDVEGAVRFSSIGNLQFNRALCEFHEYKIEERRRAEGFYSPKQDYLLVERDVMKIARGNYDRWPLHNAKRVLRVSN